MSQTIPEEMLQVLMDLPPDHLPMSMQIQVKNIVFRAKHEGKILYKPKFKPWISDVNLKELCSPIRTVRPTPLTDREVGELAAEILRLRREQGTHEQGM